MLDIFQKLLQHIHVLTLICLFFTVNIHLNVYTCIYCHSLCMFVASGLRADADLPIKGQGPRMVVFGPVKSKNVTE